MGYSETNNVTLLLTTFPFYFENSLILSSPHHITSHLQRALFSISTIAAAGLSTAVSPTTPVSSRVSCLGRSKAPAPIPSPRSLSKPRAHASSPESHSRRVAGRSQDSLTSQLSNDSDPVNPENSEEGLSAPPPSNSNVASSSNREGISARKFSQKTKRKKREAREKRKREKPQRVARAKALIKAFSDNKSLDKFTSDIDIQEDIVAVDLYLDEYRDLLREIEEDSDLDSYFHSKLKYEYASRKGAKQFAIRMPGPVHANLAGAISSAVTEWSALVRNGTSRSIAGMIQYVAGKNVQYGDKTESDTNVPDGSFELTGLEDSRHRGLVIEVGWTQESWELRQKCQGYIEKSKGLVRTVVGIDLHELYQCYKTVIGRVGKVTAREKKATGLKRIHEMATETLEQGATGKISVWHSQWDEATGTAKAKIAFSNHKFRDKDGKPIGKVALCLSLQAFISERTEDQFPSSHNPRCAISAEYLCSRLDDGLKEIFTYVPQSPRDKTHASTQNDLSRGLMFRLVQDEGEPSEPPSFLPGPPTTQDNAAPRAAVARCFGYLPLLSLTPEFKPRSAKAKKAAQLKKESA
ncbi:hypothetical protein F5Y12DRAFT_795719 [Xylaria sp. FL1777]|nr:hypothetical protein F5Y12DRAFT_795719 [Xylaria sp. FL1777]